MVCLPLLHVFKTSYLTVILKEQIYLKGVNERKHTSPLALKL